MTTILGVGNIVRLDSKYQEVEFRTIYLTEEASEEYHLRLAVSGSSCTSKYLDLCPKSNLSS